QWSGPEHRFLFIPTSPFGREPGEGTTYSWKAKKDQSYLNVRIADEDAGISNLTIPFVTRTSFTLPSRSTKLPPTGNLVSARVNSTSAAFLSLLKATITQAFAVVRA